MVKETYFGKNNVLSVGIGYFYSKISKSGDDYKEKAYTVDIKSWRRGRAAYGRVYAMAARAAGEGSILFLSSCSYYLSREDFIRVASEALLNAGWRGYRFLGSLRGSAPDHTLRGEEYLDYLKASFVYLER